MGQQDLAHFGLFDQLNMAVDREHFHLLSANSPGIWNTHANRNSFTYVHLYKDVKISGASEYLTGWLFHLWGNNAWTWLDIAAYSNEFQTLCLFRLFSRTAVCRMKSHSSAFNLELTAEDRLMGAVQWSHSELVYLISGDALFSEQVLLGLCCFNMNHTHLNVSVHAFKLSEWIIIILTFLLFACRKNYLLVLLVVFFGNSHYANFM